MAPQEKPIAPRQFLAAIGCLMVVGALSSCQIAPSRPLLSPIGLAGEYGYADAPIGDNRYQVSYTGPSQRSFRSTESRERIKAAESAQALDFALWHAAQIALAQGFAGFRVSNIRTNVDSVDEPDYDPFYAPGWHPANRLGGPLMARNWGGWVSTSPYIDTWTQVVIDVVLVRSLETGDYDARATIDRLSNAYPGATSPTSPPAR